MNVLLEYINLYYQALPIMLALCLMLLGIYYTLPIMLALCLMLLGTYYAQNYAGIIGRSLTISACIFHAKLNSVQ